MMELVVRTMVPREDGSKHWALTWTCLHSPFSYVSTAPVCQFLDGAPVFALIAHTS